MTAPSTTRRAHPPRRRPSCRARVLVLAKLATGAALYVATVVTSPRFVEFTTDDGRPIAVNPTSVATVQRPGQDAVQLIRRGVVSWTDEDIAAANPKDLTLLALHSGATFLLAVPYHAVLRTLRGEPTTIPEALRDEPAPTVETFYLCTNSACPEQGKPVPVRIPKGPQCPQCLVPMLPAVTPEDHHP
jgi:hypothetical protein